MADAQKKNCPQIPVKGSYCIPTECSNMCKKQHGTVGRPWEGPTNSSDNARKTDSSVSEHDKALVRKNNKFWFPSQEVFLRKEVNYRKPSYMTLAKSIKSKQRLSGSSSSSCSKTPFQKKQYTMSYNGDVNVKRFAGSEWTDLYPPAQGTGRHMWAKANIVPLNL
ncbi:protein IQ-DOMAIN 8-like [Raphanus sativus]|uniref:Protein IQ-DOMAIN 8-like n=1 Tax=Raphanus sativus TaxID=3726 RepID=A0A9W3C734_RAPSA|nr:protein IQ-DOMAIN 8-like [Raphanus sativus]